MTEDERVKKKARVSPSTHISQASANSGASAAKPASGKYLFVVELTTATGAVGVGDVDETVEFEGPEAAGLMLFEAMGDSNISISAIDERLGYLVLNSTSNLRIKIPLLTRNADHVPASSIRDLRVSPKKQAHALSTLGVGKIER